MICSRYSQPDRSLEPAKAPAADSQLNGDLEPVPTQDQPMRMYPYIAVNHWQIFKPSL